MATEAEIEAAARAVYRIFWGGLAAMPVNYEATMKNYLEWAKPILEAAERVRADANQIDDDHG